MNGNIPLYRLQTVELGLHKCSVHILGGIQLSRHSYVKLGYHKLGRYNHSNTARCTSHLCYHRCSTYIDNSVKTLTFDIKNELLHYAQICPNASLSMQIWTFTQLMLGTDIR